MKKYRFFVLTLLFASILASLTSYNVSALSFGSGHELSYSPASSTMTYYSNNVGDILDIYGNDNNGGGVAFLLPREIGHVRKFVLRLQYWTGSKSLVNIPYRVCFNNPNDLLAWVGFSGNGYTTVISNNFTYTSAGCFSGDILLYVNVSVNNLFLGGNNGGTVIGSFNDGGSVVFGKATQIILSDDADYSSVLSAIKNNTDGIADTLNTMSSDMSSLRSAQEQEAQTAQDTYDKTIEDEQTASSSAGGFSFNFSIPNPFEIFRVSDGCVSTPTIDSWLHLEGDWQSPHCPVIPAEVRNTLTPVVTLIVTLATLLVVIRWVSGTAVDVAGNSSWLNDKPEKGAK